MLQDAGAKLAAGKVVEARAVLKSRRSDRSPDIALALARAYDPNVLKGLPSPDAEADVKQAEEWYRMWHDLSVEQGLVSDGTSIDRILKNLR